MELNNPAARLLNILELGKEIEVDTSCRAAWCTLLGVEPADRALFLVRISKVMGLTSEIYDSLKKIPNVNPVIYLNWAPFVENALFKSDMDGQWNSFIRHINEHVFSYLTMTSDFLSHKNPEPVIPKSNLDSIHESSIELTTLIIESKLPADLKHFMIDHLNKISGAIDDYKFSGSSKIVEAVNGAFGQALLDKRIAQNDIDPETTSKFWGFMGKLALVVTVAAGAHQLAPAVYQLLPDLNTIEHGEYETSSPIPETLNA